MALPAGTRLGPYAIVSPVGCGGMGEVYRAHDSRLGRDVAIKVLPAEVSRDPERRQRFDREARAIAALNHPHICAVHDIGEQDGLDYLVMELLDGESLADRLTRGPMPAGEALQSAITAIETLGVVHGHGLIHRDLKPANIFLSAHGLKLLDFGLARSLTVGVETALTHEGFIVGYRPLSGARTDSRRGGGSPDGPLRGGRRDLPRCSRDDRPSIARRPSSSCTARSSYEEPAPLPSGTVAPAVEEVLRQALAKDPGRQIRERSGICECAPIGGEHG